MQLFSAAAFSLAHGANDAQKTMGIILALLIANGVLPDRPDVPLWVVLRRTPPSGSARSSAGGGSSTRWARRSRSCSRSAGMAAETAAAATICSTRRTPGIPVSTTQTITGAIVGVGSTQRLSAVRWGVAGRVVWAWVLTIPGAFVISYVAYLPFKAVTS